jgi:hypothetical protein
MWPQEAELIFGPYTSLNFESKQDMGPKSLTKLGVSISTNRPSLEGLDLDDCNITPPWANSVGNYGFGRNYMYYGVRTIEQARMRDAGRVRGRLQVKVKGRLLGSWLGADCEYNSATHEFSSTDRKGKQQRVADCWVLDVPNSSGKQKHQFDVVSNTQSMPVVLAAVEAGEKRRWLAAMGTMQARQKRVAEEAEEQALMTKHGVSTIEEARRKEAEEQALMAEHGVSTIKEARRKEAEQQEEARRQAERERQEYARWLATRQRHYGEWRHGWTGLRPKRWSCCHCHDRNSSYCER